MSLGVHFALTSEDEHRLLAAADDNAVLQIVENIEETSFEVRADDRFCETDKAWDAIHRCLTDGRLEYANGTYPLNATILGGRQLIEGEDYTVSYVTAGQVRDVAESLEIVAEEWLRQLYAALAGTDYAGPHNEDDLEYTWENLQDVREFFSAAAQAGRAVIFTVDA